MGSEQRLAVEKQSLQTFKARYLMELISSTKYLSIRAYQNLVVVVRSTDDQQIRLVKYRYVVLTMCVAFFPFP